MNMGLIPFKSTEKKGKASGKSLVAFTLFLISITGWALVFK